MFRLPRNLAPFKLLYISFLKRNSGYVPPQNHHHTEDDERLAQELFSQLNPGMPMPGRDGALREQGEAAEEIIDDQNERRPAAAAAAQRTVDEITDHGGTYEIILKLCDYLREQHKAQFMHTRGLGRELQAGTLRDQVDGVRRHAAHHEVQELEQRLSIREDADRACNANFGGNKVDICRQIADLMRQAAPIADWKVRDRTWKDRLKDLTGPEIMAVLDEDGIFDIV